MKVNEENVNIEDDDEDDLQKITTSAAFVGPEQSQLRTGHVNLASLYNLPRLSDSPPAYPAGTCPAWAGCPACPAGPCLASPGGAWRSVQH